MGNNAAAVVKSIDLYISRKRAAHIAWYRWVVWEVFKALLRTTPQYTGRAVANWELGIGSPTTWHDQTLGESAEWQAQVLQGHQQPHQQGDEKWMRVARSRNRGKLDSLNRGTKVYFCNNVTGDSDGGKLPAGNQYMAELQNPAYAASKLREVHQPYIQAQVVVHDLMGRGSRKFGTYLYKPGGSSYEITDD